MHPVTSAGVLAGRDDELALLNGLLRGLAQSTTTQCSSRASRASARPPSSAPLPFLDALEARAALVNARRTTIAALLRGEVANSGYEASREAEACGTDQRDSAVSRISFLESAGESAASVRVRNATRCR
jgi:hypothetical protein